MKKYALVCLTLFFCSCRNDQYVPDVCFEQKVLPILVNKCGTSGCHNNVDLKGGYDFTNYEGVMKAVAPNHSFSSKLWIQIQFGKMPPKGSPQLSDEEKMIVKSWIQFGAKNSKCSAPTVCDTNRTILYGEVNSIFNLNCIGCHNTNNPSGGWDLSNYEGVKSAANSGVLLGSIEWLPGYSKMPKSASKLPNCDISKIKKWINDGMPQ